MARTRLIKPEFFRSRSLSQVSRDARYLFTGLWCEADSAGRGKADPRIVKGAVFALDDDVTNDMVEGLLRDLARTGHIVLYEVDGEPLFEIVKFAAHQSKAYLTGEAKYPPPNDSNTLSTDEPPDSDDSNATALEVCSDSPATCTCGLDSCSVCLARREGKGRENSYPNVDASTSADGGQQSSKLEESFAAWYKIYPRHEARKDALKAWKGLKAKEREQAQSVVAAYAQERHNEDPRFTPLPATWLRQGRWEDVGQSRQNSGVIVDEFTGARFDIRACQ